MDVNLHFAGIAYVKSKYIQAINLQAETDYKTVNHFAKHTKRLIFIKVEYCKNFILFLVPINVSGKFQEAHG